jgi:hypothetical protein
MKAPSIASIVKAHPNARCLSVSDGRAHLGRVVADDAGRQSSRRAWAWDAQDRFLGEFASRLEAVKAVPPLSAIGGAA